MPQSLAVARPLEASSVHRDLEHMSSVRLVGQPGQIERRKHSVRRFRTRTMLEDDVYEPVGDAVHPRLSNIDLRVT